MSRLLTALAVGRELLSLVEAAVGALRRRGEVPSWAAIRREIADGVLRGDLDRAIERAKGSSTLIRDFVERG